MLLLSIVKGLVSVVVMIRGLVTSMVSSMDCQVVRWCDLVILRTSMVIRPHGSPG